MPALDDLNAPTPINALPHDAAARLETVVAKHLGRTFPTAALTVAQGGEVLINAAWGWIDPESRQIPAQPDTWFDLASVSKLFTTTAFLSLVSAGALALDQPLVDVIPEFGASGPRPLDGGMDPHSKVRLPVPPEAEGQWADPNRVTLRHLLTHTSGLAPWRDVFNAAGPAPAPPTEPDPVPRALRWARALAALCSYPFVGQPGEGVVRYSDLGLMLLGEAASRAAGSPGALEVVVRDRVTAPLGLPSITYNPIQQGLPRRQIAPTEDDPAWRGRRCWGEVHDENACGVGGVAGHAGLFGVARDVAALGQAWLDRSARLGIAPGLLTEAVRQQAATDGMRRGLGWLLKAAEDSSAGNHFSPDSFGHTGFTGTSLWVDPARSLVVALLTNRVYPGRFVEGIHEFRRALHDVLAEAVDHL